MHIEKNKLKKLVLKNKFLIIWLIIFIFFLIYQIIYLLKFKQLPACLYGCDLYSHLGTMYHLAEGSSVISNGQLLWTQPWIPYLYHFCVIFFSKIFMLNIMIGNILFNIPLYIIASGSLSYLTYKITKNKWIPIFTLLLITLKFPIFKYSQFSHHFLFPLFVLIFFDFVFKKKKKLKDYIIVGIVYGLTGYSNTISFLGMNLMIFVYIIYSIVKEKDKIVKIIKSQIIPILIGLPIVLLYWWWPIVSKFHSVNDLTYYAHKDFSIFALQLSEFWQSIKTILWINRFSVFTVIMILGIITLFIIKTKNKKIKKLKQFNIILLISVLIGAGHHFITYPLFKISAFPYMFGSLFSMILLIFAFIFVSILIQKIIKNKKLQIIIIIIILIFAGINAYTHHATFISGNKFHGNALNPLQDNVVKMQEWINENTDINNVFLTTKETGFMLNGLTGRKLVVYRTTHADPFSDIWTCQIDSAIILYSNNSVEREKLIKKYNISYFYWDYYWINSEWAVDNSGRIIGKFDPLLVPYNKTYEQRLIKNNVKFVVDNFWFDPAVQGSDIPKLKGILITQDNYYNSTHPWNPELDKYLKKVWNYKQNNQEYATIYKINIENQNYINIKNYQI